jgi:hypothetical protein
VFNQIEQEKIKTFLGAMFGVSHDIDIDQIIEKLRWSCAVSPKDGRNDILGYITVFCQFADAPNPAVATAEFRFNPAIEDSQGRNPGEYFLAGQRLLAE